MKKEEAEKIVGLVKDFYNEFAQSFSATRQTNWDELGIFVGEVQEGEKILDLGCGNGRLVELLKDKKVDYTGVDISEQLLEIARQKYPGNKFILIDGLHLPFPDNHFDWVFSIAVLQHLPSREMRRDFLRESCRILKSQGKIVLTVWYLWQWKNIMGPFLKHALAKLLGKSSLDFGDIFYRWRETKEARYLHMFTVRELGQSLKRIGYRVKKIGIIKRGRLGKNIFAVAIKR